MIKKKFILPITLFVLAMSAATSQAQFMNLNMEVEPEISVRVIQDLNFGSFISNTGMQRIEKHNPNIGIFEIRVFGNQNVAISLNMPDSLSNSDSSVREHVPLNLKASYSNTQNQSAASSILINDNRASFPIKDTNVASGARQWQQAYIYIFGEVLIGDVPQGEYSASLVLSVEYQ